MRFEFFIVILRVARTDITTEMMNHLPLMRMKIGIDIRSIGNNNNTDYAFFLTEVLKKMTLKFGQDEFLLISDKTSDSSFFTGENVKSVVKGPATGNPLLLKLWYDVKLPAILKKHDVEILVAGPGVCSLQTNIPQCLVIDDLSYLQFPSDTKRGTLFFLRRYMKRFMLKSGSILTGSNFLSEGISQLFPPAKEKIHVIQNPGKNFHALDENEKDKTRKAYTEGKNYFLFSGPIDHRSNIINLLKAFSVFKKRQKADWKLVIAGSISPRFKKFATDLKTYKYRDSLVLPERVTEKELGKLTGAAYAMVNPGTAAGWSAMMLAALRSEVPLILSKKSSPGQWADDAVLYIDPSDHTDIAEKMMLIYKDESFRKNMVEKAVRVAGEFTWDKTAEEFMKVIRETAGRGYKAV